MERMRSDDDFPGLFSRLNNLQEISRRSPTAAKAWLDEMVEGYAEADLLYAADGAVNDTVYSSWSFAQSNLLVVEDFEATKSDFVNLRDGRRAFVPTAYYDDFTLPAGVRDFHVAVEVPSAPAGGDVAAGTTLREDLPLPRFGLPADLNGDGKIDDLSHAEDYSTVPVIVTFHWTSSLGAEEEMRLSTWIWGYR